MSWFGRLFGQDQGDAELVKAQARAAEARTEARGDHPDVPLERQGLNGEYDQSGLAKRVAQALDEAGVEHVETIWVAQHNTSIVLKGKAPNQAVLDMVVEVARGVNGCSDVQADQVSVEG